MQYFRDWLDQWFSPTIIITLLGVIFAGVVWGIQLNISVLRLTAALATEQSLNIEQEKDIRESRENVIRGITLLDNIERRVANNETRIREINVEDRKLHEQIIENRSNIRSRQ